jgi:hypothetical protein
MVCRSDDQPWLKLRPDKEDAAQRSPAGAGFTKPSSLKVWIVPVPRSSSLVDQQEAGLSAKSADPLIFKSNRRQSFVVD